jgi:alkanesulfonate monooxygenase SsuD/methylene tetrahydromethanopterin reductase-like flavin-dependent oxidoreductase (luciferase family)
VELPVSVGLRVPAPVFPRGAAAVAEFVAHAEEAGLDRLCIGDHVTFYGGQGFDALVNATALAVLSKRVQIETAVYLLPLRHPVPVARQVVSVSELAPGRFRFGVGIGGEDRSEVLACGVDPATRGRRMNEALPLLRGLLRGERVGGTGPHFAVEDVSFASRAAANVPILIGGRSTAALRRVSAFGDGWLGLWVSPERFAQSCLEIAESASAVGRGQVDWQHGMHVWCGFDDDGGVGRDRLAAAMEGLYRTPFEKFARYSPAGRPEDVAAFLQHYIDVGCRSFNLLAVAGSDTAAIEGARTVRTLMGGTR